MLTVITYYLAANGKINAFPTYLAGLAFISLWLLPGGVPAGLRMPVTALVVALLSYLAVSTVWGHAPVLETLRYIGFMLLVLAFVLGIPTVEARFSGFVRALVILTILSAFVSAIYSIYFFHVLDYHPLDEKDRLYALGRLGNPVVAALSYGVALVLAACRATAARPTLERLFWLPVLLLLVYVVTLTGTRSVWVGMFGSALAAIVLAQQWTWRTRVILLAVTSAVACLLVFAAIHSEYGDEILRRSTSFRPEIWSGALSKIHGIGWLFGNGGDAPSAIQYGEFVFVHAHSIYIATLYYGGVVGLLLLLALIATTYFGVTRLGRSELRTIVLVSLTFGVVTLAFDGDRLLEKADYSWVVFWLPISLAICALRSVRNQGTERS